MPLSPPSPPGRRDILYSGYQGGWFHPTTGYTFPAATLLAQFVSERAPREALGTDFDALLRERARQQRYLCFLNRLLYGGFAPSQRFNVLERFYRLPEQTIARFYAMRTTAFDRARILCGRPPRGLSLRHAFSKASDL